MFLYFFLFLFLFATPKRTGRSDGKSLDVEHADASSRGKTTSNDGTSATRTSGTKRERNKRRFTEEEDKNLLDVLSAALPSLEPSPQTLDP